MPVLLDKAVGRGAAAGNAVFEAFNGRLNPRFKAEDWLSGVDATADAEEVNFGTDGATDVVSFGAFAAAGALFVGVQAAFATTGVPSARGGLNASLRLEGA